MLNPENPHFKFPFTLNAEGRINQIEQDTIEHVQSCEEVIVRCPLGFRDDRPEFGWPWPEFANIPIDPQALEDALATFEPRGRANAVEWAEAANAAVRNISVDVEVMEDHGER